MFCLYPYWTLTVIMMPSQLPQPRINIKRFFVLFKQFSLASYMKPNNSYKHRISQKNSYCSITFPPFSTRYSGDLQHPTPSQISNNKTHKNEYRPLMKRRVNTHLFLSFKGSTHTHIWCIPVQGLMACLNLKCRFNTFPDDQCYLPLQPLVFL